MCAGLSSMHSSFSTFSTTAFFQPSFTSGIGFVVTEKIEVARGEELEELLMQYNMLTLLWRKTFCNEGLLAILFYFSQREGNAAL